jgi:hypothetical protein
MKPELQQMTRKELRAYVLSHREDEEALHLYMDRLHNDPDVVRHTGGFDPDGNLRLQELIINNLQSWGEFGVNMSSDR